MYEKITPNNVLMYAIRNYTNPHCEGEKEFEDDLKRFKYIKNDLSAGQYSGWILYINKVEQASAPKTLFNTII